MKTKNLIILRGIPGAGKTTFAELLNGEICCADDYLIINGKYTWSIENSKVAHSKCQEKCESLMEKQTETIIIANTNTTESQLHIYYMLAKQFGYKVFSVIVENRHNGKSTHSVPEETINKMINRFQIKLI